MKIALASRVVPASPDPGTLLARLEALDLRALFCSDAPARPRALRAALHGAGVEVSGVSMDVAVAAELASRPVLAERLGTRTLVVDGGPRVPDADLGAQAEALAVRAHAWIAQGLRPALRPAADATELLGTEALGWLLDDQAHIGLWLDPASADHPTLFDRYAGRVRGCLCSGTDAAGVSGQHPEAGGHDWRKLSTRIPRTATWVLDLRPGAPEDECADAVRFLASLT